MPGAAIHPSGSLSIADLLAVLYSGVMNINPADPKGANRDWLKGKGVSYKENAVEWQHDAAPDREQLERAVAELDAVLSAFYNDFGGIRI
jgi:hypothetical protein